MGRIKARNIAGMTLAAAVLVACGDGKSTLDPEKLRENTSELRAVPSDSAPSRNTIWAAFNRPNTEVQVAVNKYLWSASLEVLNFLPVQTVDPFTGVIATGFGTPPGGGRAYRATVLIDDPALDARSLNVALQSRGGPVSQATARAVEDAILSRARELRIADNKL